MTRNLLMKKELPLVELLQDSLPILAGVADLRVISLEADARRLLRRGAVLIGVAKIDNDPGGTPFRFALGWPRDKGDPPVNWDLC